MGENDRTAGAFVKYQGAAKSQLNLKNPEIFLGVKNAGCHDA
jgi:hypothetical protein